MSTYKKEFTAIGIVYGSEDYQKWREENLIEENIILFNDDELEEEIEVQRRFIYGY